MASDFCLVLPSNASMTTHPNNTLAQYITNLPRRISLSDDGGEWECGHTEIHYPHDWYNVRKARLMVEHDGKMETDAYFEDRYYDSSRAPVKTLNGDKPGRVIYTTKIDACVCVSVCLCAKFDQFLPVRSHFDTKRPVNFFHIATFQSATFGRPLFAFVLCVLRQKIIKKPKMLGKRIDRRNR